jgi:NadR type nicotinamide-nucleotide adenylyltransferase
MIRANPLDYLDYLPGVVRAYFIKRFTAIGAESTGTTTISKALAHHYQTPWVPEYGRLYWEAKVGTYTASDEIEWYTREFVHIATMQAQMEDELARSANRVLICDTDPFATSIWHRRYMRFDASEVHNIGVNRNYTLYFLTGDEIPFVQDGTRDGERLRHQMHQWFIDALEQSGKPYVLLTGAHETRLQTAIELINTKLVPTML